MSKRSGLRGAIAGFIVKSAASGETEAITPGHPRFEVKLAAMELMTMSDLNGLCRDELREREEVLEKQASRMDAVRDAMGYLTKKDQKLIRSALRRNFGKGVIFGTAVATPAVLGTGKLLQHLRRKREEQGGMPKRAAYEPHRSNNQLLDWLRNKVVVGGRTEDA